MIKKTEERDGVYFIWIEMERKAHSCPKCGEMTNKIHDCRMQKVRHQPIFGRQTILFYRKRRYRCDHCGKRFYESNSITLIIKESRWILKRQFQSS